MFGFSIREILPHIYHLHFESAYDLAMHFLRSSEYYESPKFHRKIFTLVDYMEWYAKEHGEGAFTYPKDWSGFNVPSWALRKVRAADIQDLNKYDQRMFTLIDWVEERESSDYYFIGTSSAGYARTDEEDEEDVLDHKIAHALYTVNADYRSEVGGLFLDWKHEPGHKGEEIDSAEVVLKGMGYHETTFTDEIHAYCATGPCNELEGVISKKEMEPFQKLFKEFKGKGSQAAEDATPEKL